MRVFNFPGYTLMVLIRISDVCMARMDKRQDKRPRPVVEGQVNVKCQDFGAVWVKYGANCSSVPYNCLQSEMWQMSCLLGRILADLNLYPIP